MRNIKFVVYREGKYFVSQCLNTEVSSFGNTIQEAIDNLKEAVELLFEDETGENYFHEVGEALIGEDIVNA